MEELIEKIVSKKELSSIDRDFARKILDETISENRAVFEVLEEKKFNQKSKEFDLIVKKTRKKLRNYFGSYNASINPLKKKSLREEIVKKHLSTRERLGHIKEFAEFIGAVKSVLDLGCGYNPYFYDYLIGRPKYLASDISLDLNNIKAFFEEKGIDGDIVKLDLTLDKDLEILGRISADFETTLLLKVVDPLEMQQRNITKKVLESIKSKYLVVSFSTTSISGKTKMKTERKWFYELIKDKKHEEIELGNEKYIKILNC